VKASLLPAALARLRPGELLVHELFESIQGESTYAGWPCFFIRLAGCHLRCSWCDAQDAFYEGSVLTVEECLESAERAGSRLVEVTGGEPLLQKSVYPLLRALCDRGHEVLLETSGGIRIGRVDRRVRRIVDWKCPGSGMHERNKPAVIEELRPGDELKLVVADRRDYEWARRWLEMARESRRDIGSSIQVHFSPAGSRLRGCFEHSLAPEELAGWILADRLPVRLNLQIHKILGLR
jgi:7-carboxy-7-deazaguanine synthase